MSRGSTTRHAQTTGDLGFENVSDDGIVNKYYNIIIDSIDDNIL